MDKRGIAGIIAFVILLGCFFQFSRMDGFLKLDSAKKSLQKAYDLCGIYKKFSKLKKTIKTAKGETWEITITYDDSAEIPEGAELKVDGGWTSF